MVKQLELPLNQIDFATLQFTPLPDISTFELAQAMLVLVPSCHKPTLQIEDAFNRLEPEVRRHFSYNHVKVKR